MKFKKDNSDVELTQEVKDSIIAKKEAEIAKVKARAEQEKLRQIADDQKKLKIFELQSQVDAIMAPVVTRVKHYGTITDQFDRLWHDIDEGRIQANTAPENSSWYGNIKLVKNSIPIEGDWSTKAQELIDQINNLTANNV